MLPFFWQIRQNRDFQSRVFVFSAATSPSTLQCPEALQDISGWKILDPLPATLIGPEPSTGTDASPILTDSMHGRHLLLVPGSWGDPPALHPHPTPPHPAGAGDEASFGVSGRPAGEWDGAKADETRSSSLPKLVSVLDRRAWKCLRGGAEAKLIYSFIFFSHKNTLVW